MSQKNALITILLFYFIGASITGMFGIEANSLAHSYYQAALFVLLFGSVLYTSIKNNTKINFVNVRPLLVYITLLIAAALPAAHRVLVYGGSLAEIAQMAIPPILASTLLIGFSSLRLDKQDIHKIMKVIVVFLAFGSLYSFAVDYEAILSISSISNSYQVDIKGFYFNRNVFGFMMASGVCLAVYLWTTSRKKLYLLLSFVMCVSMLTSLSRGSILFLVVCLSIFLTKRFGRKVFVPFLILLSTVPFVFSQPFVVENVLRQDNGDTGRSELREYGLKHFLEHNVFTGSGQQAITSIESRLEHNSYHNLYIESLATQGILGLAAVVISIVYALSFIRSTLKYESTLGVFLMSYLIAYVVYIYFEALPLFYATPSSIVATYMLILIPIFLHNSFKQDRLTA